MIAPFSSYLAQGKVKKGTPDRQVTSSLLRRAQLRITYARVRPATEEGAAFLLEDAYEAAREAAQALMAQEEFKPYSHEATISFLKEYHRDAFDEGVLASFDRYRLMRNDSIYRGEPVALADAEGALTFTTKVLKKIKALVVL